MSGFDDFCEGCFADAAAIIGTASVTISGIPGRTIYGVLNEFASEKELDIGGIQGTYIATLVCELDQFDDITGKLERRFDGMTATVDGRVFKINRTAIDEISLTLGLQHPNR